MPPPAGARRVDLDFVRGIAILLAVGSHFNHRDTGYTLIDLLQIPGRMFGWAGVDLFFVLSGFLVGGLIFREYQSTAAFDAKRFLIRRAFKIWPVMYFYIALVVVTGRYHWSEVVPQTLFHVQNYFPTPLNHLWSLAVEEHFYLTAAFMFGWLASAGPSRLHLVPRVLLGLMGVVLVLRLAGVARGLDAQTLQWQSQFRIDALGCGVLLAYISVFQPSQFAWLTSKKLACGMVALAGVGLLVLIRDAPQAISTIGYTITFLTGGAFLLFVYDLPAISRNGAARALAWVGSYSYPMYLLQFVSFRVGEAVWKRFSDVPMPALVELVGLYAGAVLIAVIVSKLLEQPMLNLRNRLFPSTTTARRPTAPPLGA